jgi:hypothetical protein
MIEAAQAKTWLDYVTAIGAIATPIVVLALTGAGWRFRTKMERQAVLEDKLREDRIGTYNAILKPFIILLMSEKAWESDPENEGKDKNDVASRILLSLDYREQGFRLSLVGSDPVVRSYNDLMQFSYRLEENPAAADEKVRTMMGLLGRFLLEIRKSMGNEATQMTNWEMLEWFLTDARRYRDAERSGRMGDDPIPAD